MLVVIFTCCLQGCIQSVLDVINVSTLRVSISNAVLVLVQVSALCILFKHMHTDMYV